MTDILNPIKNIEVLRANLEQSSCLTKDAFMKLADDEDPTLNYNLPQSSTFTTYGYIRLDLKASDFVETPKTIDMVTTPHYFNENPAVIRQQFNRSVQLGTNDMGMGLRVAAVEK